MKNWLPRFLIATLLCIPQTILAQNSPQPIHFANGDFIPASNIDQPTSRAAALSNSLFNQQYFVVVQFSFLPNLQQQGALEKAGMKLETYLPGKAWFATVKPNFNFTLAKSFNISSIDNLPALFKMDAELVNFTPAKDKQSQQNIAVGYYQSIDKATVISELIKAGANIVSTKYDVVGIIFIRPDAAAIKAVADLPFVSSLHLQGIKDNPINYKTIGAHGVGGLHALNGKNLNGRGVTIGVGDNADISSHTDFTGRLINRSPWIPQDHGTHTTGTAAGGGIINVKNQGMAPGATIVSQFFSDIIVNVPAYITDYNMVVTNNSYYSGEANCPGNGEYDVLSNYADNQMKTYPELLHVVAAGNEGTNTCGSYLPGFGTVKTGWQSAKDVLTVGAINIADYTIAYFSSRGPLKDGRIKPEIVANGWAVLSTNAYDTYGLNFGTSMATPGVTGITALMYERFRQKNAGANPRSSLIKAIACNTAEDLGNAGPDFTFGFGTINARRAVEAIDSNRYIINAVSNGGNAAHVVTVPANTRRLKVMLYWADNAAAIIAASALINDLDLTVTEPSATIHRPLVLNAAPSNVNDVAVEGADHINNIEQVVINNPVAGNYAININGFNVPAGTQEYVISYEVDIASVTVEYPFGDEKLVPNETENIRWTAYGNEANNFTVEYSANNGANWTIIDNNVAASARTISWTVPTTITDTALIRVSRNGTSLTDQSDFNFTVLGSPTVTAANVCAGSVQLSWATIAGATSYDIVQLSGDTMKVIGNTASNNFLVLGLDKNLKTWLGVAAKNGTVSGRRSISVSAVPNSGPCTLAAFNNDIKIDTILEPNTARQGFTNAANATRPVKVVLKNTGSTMVSGPVNLSYSYNGTTVTEVINASVAAGASTTYTFTGMYTINPAGFHYDFKAWATLAADPNHLNDTAYKTVKYINNDPITSLPLTEGFETMPGNNFRTAEMAIGENKYLDFNTNTVRGRARSFVNTGFSYSGSKAMTLDQAPYNATTTVDSLTISYNLSNYSGKQLRFDFYYKNHGQSNNPGNKVWVRGSENNAWTQAYDLYANQAPLAGWKHGNININDALASSVPAQTITPTFQIRIGQEGYNSANSANAVIDIDDGYTFDDLLLNEVVNDVALLKLNSPDVSDCSLSAVNPVSVKVKNYNNVTLNNLQVSYQINSSPVVTEIISSIAPNQTLDYVFNQKANLSAYIDYKVNVWVKYPTDSYATNDSILNYTVHNGPIVTGFPYLQSFETNDGYFYAKGTNSTWEWGAPSNLIINKAPNGSKAWVTNLTGNYKDNETSYLNSPCFDISGLLQPMLSFSHIFQLEKDYDYTWVEYSTDGIAWQKLGTSTAGTNWYDNAALNNWSLSDTKWRVASFDLPTFNGNIRFRFVMSSDGGVTEEGAGIDDIHVFDKASIYTGPAITGLTQTVSGTSWINFSSGGKRIASINPNGINLGSTTVKEYPFAGPVRTENNTYYANRNIVIKPTNAPTGKVTVRFYFTDTEARALINANTCAFCARPLDAYELGITKYSSSNGDENDIISDDTTGYFQFIIPDSTIIVPYDNGYYAEFNVQNFSEFWLSTAVVKPAVSGYCEGDGIVFTAATTGSTYQWQLDSGSGYANISDNIFYTGSNTAMLQINAPPNFSGYKYRCVVNGTAGPANTIHFVNVWTGSANTDWFNPSNWSCDLIPDEYTEVVIPGGLVNYPLINANASVKKISAYPGAMATLANGVILDIKGK